MITFDRTRCKPRQRRLPARRLASGRGCRQTGTIGRQSGSDRWRCSVPLEGRSRGGCTPRTSRTGRNPCSTRRCPLEAGSASCKNSMSTKRFRM